MQPAAGMAQPGARTRPPAPAFTEPVGLGVRHTAPFGSHVVDHFGRSVYAFAADSRGVPSTCYDECARAWPPVLSAGTPRSVSDEAKSSKFGTVRRKDGAIQATYDGWPLYYYTRDRLPGEALGHGVLEFGAEWYLIAPNGDWIGDEEPATTAPAKPDPTMGPPPMTDVPVPPDYPPEDRP